MIFQKGIIHEEMHNFKMIPLKQIIQQQQLIPVTIILKLLYQLTLILNTIHLEGMTIENLQMEDLQVREMGELEKSDIFIPQSIIKVDNSKDKQYMLEQLKDLCNLLQVFQVIKFGLYSIDVYQIQNFEEILLYILGKLNIDLKKSNWREQSLQIIYGLEIKNVQHFNEGFTYIYHVTVPYYINSQYNQIIIKWIHSEDQTKKRLMEVDNYKNLKEKNKSNNNYQINLFCYTLDVDNSTLLFLRPYSLTLKDYAKKSTGKLNLREKMKVCSKLADELKKLHDKNKIHRDIKPENIMVSGKDPYSDKFYDITDENINQIDKLQWQIIDLESAIEKGQINEFVGTKSYLPPEKMQGKPYYESFDIWQMGMCFLYFMTQQEANYTPKVDKRKANILEILNKLNNKEDKSTYSEIMHSIISKMINFNPEERPQLEVVITELNSALLN